MQIIQLITGRSNLWSEVRNKHIKKQPFCQACGSTKGLEVHHIEPFHVNPARELDETNLITLCNKNCHLAFGHLMDYNSWNVDVIKDAGEYLSKIQNRPYKIKTLSESNWYQKILTFFTNRKK